MVMRNPLQPLKGLIPGQASTVPIWFVSILFALSCGVLLILFGWFLEFLARVSYASAASAGTYLGANIFLEDRWLGQDISPLRACSTLLLLMFAVMLVISFLFIVLTKLAASISMERSFGQLRAVYSQLQVLARRRSPTLMQPLVCELTTTHIPAIREATASWLRFGPVSICLTIVCLAIAAVIDPLIAALFILAILLTQQVHYWFNRYRRRGWPVLLEQRNTMLHKIADWLSGYPMLTNLNREVVSQSSFEHQLANFRTHYVALDRNLEWKYPFTLLIACVFGLMIMFVGAVRIVRSDTPLTIIAGLVLVFAIGVAIFAMFRLMRVISILNALSPNIRHLASFLAQSPAKIDVDPSIKRPEHIQGIELRNVTLRSHNDEIALDGISAHLHAGEIVALACDNTNAQNALADLLLGFGYPSNGECFIDSVPLSKLGVDQMGELACWVAADGPLFTASVDENLRTIQSAPVKAMDLSKVLQLAKCEGAVSALQDGLATVISAGDDRLNGDIPFRLGLARAFTLKRPIVVIQEPLASDDVAMEDETRKVIEQLAANHFIVILIPARSKSLWIAHQVLFLQDGHLAASGKHANLLEQNDAYRHWNYMQFSPYLTRRQAR